ncbi:MAG: hypothetical protein CMM52_17585 [Rhodospirillaceae bacterium]|nr:hypothetical protein [Rhodospirillaceae bacterium]|tara:strand:+ start:7627 stop:8712 length:1086 start_codon:yes stop_codon:yes gene_type:complete
MFFWRDHEYFDPWPLIANPEDLARPENPDDFFDAVEALARLISPTLTMHLLEPVQQLIDEPILDPSIVSENRLLAKFSLAQQRHWAQILAESDIDVLFLKGFAYGHSFYPDPVLRQQGDLDFLVRPSDLSAVMSFLEKFGFQFRPAPQSRWGAISDASFMPFVTPDGSCDLDLHVHPDCYPAYCSLTTERLFAESQLIDAGGFAARIPCREHALLLCVTNAAKEKFDMFSARKVIDAMVLLRNTPDLDWEKVLSLAAEGNYFIPARIFFSLMVALGFPDSKIPAALLASLPRWRRNSFRKIVWRFKTLFPEDPNLLSLLWREWALCAEPAVAFYNLRLRARGMVRPGSGIPEGAPTKVEYS